MSGIFSRLVAEDDNLAAHLFESAYVLYATGDFSQAQILSALNSTLDVELSGDELTDLTAIKNEFDAEVGVANKLIYRNKLAACVYGFTHGAMTEAVVRSVLGL